jgi:hypothetical protein
MGEIVKLSELPAGTRTSSYDADIEQGLRMREDEALKVEVPQGREAANIAVALSGRIKSLGHENKLHVSRKGDAVFILHGGVKKKGKGK